ncbi:hypothetical protein [Cohnella hongkongensis]|uniref:Uncharacterized protein n=1 Tax=Cohnella hongkongensis TaxID=178337 RepID=A0ABV9FAH4_9BACL
MAVVQSAALPQQIFGQRQAERVKRMVVGKSILPVSLIVNP